MLHTPRRPVYIDLVALQWLTEKGMRPPDALVPDGLLFRVGSLSGAPPLAPLRWKLDSMLDPTLPRDPAVERIAFTYVSMLEQRERYLASQGSLGDAKEAAELAERIGRR
jgi:hypothetical protein